MHLLVEGGATVDLPCAHGCSRPSRHTSFSRLLIVEDALSPECWCLDPEVHVSEAIQLLERRGLSSAPVVDDEGSLLGIARLQTLRAAVQQWMDELQRHPDADELVIEEAMEGALATLTPDEPLTNAAVKMRIHVFLELPVIDRDARVVGVLTAADLLRFFDQQRLR